MSEGDRPETADTVVAPPTGSSSPGSSSKRPETDDTLIATATPRSDLAVTQEDSLPRATTAEREMLPKGAQIGRYLVLEPLGAGGMGAVYAAYDPELDRKVAIKVLHSGSRGSQDSGGRARMLREAQAIARLSHPNVVAVHDVGPFQQQVFIAMELVDGVTLTAWLEESPRTTAEILAMFVQAGHGLAAAHHAGLVHRDFKPDNVLVGRDGRARVVDFGLVRGIGGAEEPAAVETRDSRENLAGSMLSIALTQVGTLMGTPRYMAPEQLDRKTADARADQYSFCVALYEALYGKLPPRDADAIASRDSTPAVTSANATAAVTRVVPAHVRAALRRGLRVDPAQRWPTMDELIAELGRDPFARRRRWLTAGVAAVAIAGLATLSALALRPKHATDPCAGADERLGSAWDASRRAAVERAFTATHQPFAATSFAGVTKRLDTYATAWRHSYEESCRATYVRHEQSAELLDLRTACLTRRRSELAAFVDLLGTADVTLVQHAVSATESLRNVADCDDLAALQAPVPPPSDPEARKSVDDMREQLTRLDALQFTARYSESLPGLAALLQRAVKVGYRPLEAEVALTLASLQSHSGDTAHATSTFIEAYVAAVAGRLDEVAVKAANGMVYESTGLAKLERAEEWAAIAQATVDRIGNPPRLQALVYNGLGHVLTTEGKREEAAAIHERARQLREHSAPGSLELATSYANLAHVYDEIGRYTESREMGERALAIELKELGPEHPEVATVLNNLGNTAVDQGELDAARDYYLRARAIRDHDVAAGGDMRALADSEHNLGELALVQDRLDEARGYYERAIAVREKIDPDDPEITLPITSLGTVLRRQGKCAEAMPQFERSLAIIERKLTRDHPYAGDALVGIGACQRELGKLDASQPTLERALAIRKADGRPSEVAEVEFELARTLRLRGATARATELANAARTIYAADKATAKELADVDAWLKPQ